MGDTIYPCMILAYERYTRMYDTYVCTYELFALRDVANSDVCTYDTYVCIYV